MIPHFIVNSDTNTVLEFTYDFDEKTTILSLKEPTANGFKIIKEKKVEDLLRHPVTIGERWLAASMLVREWGSPAFVEEWDWDTLECIKKHSIEGRLGLIQFEASPNGDFVIIDRFFPEEGYGHSKIFKFPEFIEVGRVQLDSNLQSPLFDEKGERLILIHTDQGGAETRLLVKEGEAFEQKFEFAEKQVVMDMTYTAMHFSKNGLLVWSLDLSSELGFYDAISGDLKFLCKIEDEYSEILEEDVDFDFDFYFSNMDLKIYANDQYSYVGSVGKVYKIDLSSGEVCETIEVADLRFIVQIRRMNDLLILIDHEGNLGKIALT